MNEPNNPQTTIGWKSLKGRVAVFLEVMWTIALFVFIYWLSPRDFMWLVAGIAGLFLMVGIGIVFEKRPALGDPVRDFAIFVKTKHALFFRRYSITIFLSVIFIIAELFSPSRNFRRLFTLLFLLWIIRGVFQIIGDWLQWKKAKNKPANNKDGNVEAD